VTTPVTATVVLPGDVDDLTRPSGGNAYDRRICGGLATLGRPVREVVVEGAWPAPDADARAALAGALAALPDDGVVLVDGLVAGGVPDIVVPQARRLRLAILVHLPLAAETGLPPALAADLDARERRTLRVARAVVATSPWAGRTLVERHGLDARRVHVVTPGTDHAPVAPGTDGASRLLCVASVIPRKGHDLLVEALTSTADLPWSCLCVGPLSRDTGYVRRVRHLVEERGLGDRVRLDGPRTGAALDAAYATADLMVLPSRAETFGMVVAESLARAVPVLATAVDGLPETLGRAPDGDLPGMLVPPDEVSALARALRLWLTDEALRTRLRRAALHRRDVLGRWDEASGRIATVLDRLAKEPQ
jgi:glycosyltransferase involved in cell wall biosynthesis